MTRSVTLLYNPFTKLGLRQRSLTNAVTSSLLLKLVLGKLGRSVLPVSSAEPLFRPSKSQFRQHSVAEPPATAERSYDDKRDPLSRSLAFCRMQTLMPAR